MSILNDSNFNLCSFQPWSFFYYIFALYKGSTHKHIACIYSWLVFLTLISNNTQRLHLGGQGEQPNVSRSFNKLYRLYVLVDCSLVYFWGVVFFHNQLLELWYSNPTSLFQLRPSHCCLDCSNDVGCFPVITLLILPKIALAFFFQIADVGWSCK